MERKNVVIDGVEYALVSSDGEIRIVILQRGWAMIGKFERNGNDCKLHNASVIRRWGTSEGLGELAKKGKLAETKLDKCYGVVEFDYLTVVATLKCEEKVWKEL